MREQIEKLRDGLLMKIEAIDGFISLGFLSDSEPLKENLQVIINNLTEILKEKEG